MAWPGGAWRLRNRGRDTVTVKQRIAAYLDDTNREVGAWVTVAIALLILASAAIFVVETYPLSDRLQALLRVADWVILTLFTVEYGLRLWSAERPWHYALSPYGLVDLLAILPFVLGFVDTPVSAIGALGYGCCGWCGYWAIGRLWVASPPPIPWR
jgi:VIT1/CCC1 family predicted Fe2+/Mn2+ transporter